MDLWTRIAAASDHFDVLRHPFYVRWSAGELSKDELSLYAGQYAHAVEAIAAASDRAAQLAPSGLAAELDAHAVEELDHVELWERFAAAAGAPAGADPLPETAACAAAWAGADRDLLGTLVSLYSIESAQPAISATKLAGLVEHYGYREGPATEYFALHARRDAEHAASARRMVEQALAEAGTVADEQALVSACEDVLEANWLLLDGVLRATV